MKHLKLISAAIVASALTFGTANAMQNPDVFTGVVGVNSAELSVRIDDGVATLFGNVDSRIEAHLAKNYLQNMDGVDRVIDLVTIN